MLPQGPESTQLVARDLVGGLLVLVLELLVPRLLLLNGARWRRGIGVVARRRTRAWGLGGCVHLVAPCAFLRHSPQKVAWVARRGKNKY